MSFSHATVSPKRHCFRNLLSTLSSSQTKSVHCSVASQLAERLRLYAPSNVKKRDIAPECMLRCRPTFSSSLMVSVAVSKLGCTELFCVEPGVKVDGRYHRKVLLKKQMLLVICVTLPVTRTCFNRAAHRRTMLTRQFSCCSRKHHNLSPPICGLLPVRT